MSKILVTGGAGFVGSHLVDALVEQGHTVTVFDNLEPQVHGTSEGLPDYFNHDARFIKGDMRDTDALTRVLKGQEVIFHDAAMVGVGQSMYQITRYLDVNTLGTAKLMELVVEKFRDSVKKIVVASSMSIYGEGLYSCAACGDIVPALRADEQLQQHSWEHRCPQCGAELQPKPTPESKPLHSTSIYALSKKDQEEMVLMLAQSYGIPAVALRYFNIYGPRQSLSNPYTGVCAIFSSCLKNDHQPIIYEDGLQSRDFISVHDIVRANILAMQRPEANFQAINVGTGQPTTIRDVAQVLAASYEKPDAPMIANQFRSGDIRHCIADISRAKELLGFEPQVSFENGMRELVEWGKQVEAEDRTREAAEELSRRGLAK